MAWRVDTCDFNSYTYSLGFGAWIGQGFTLAISINPGWVIRTKSSIIVKMAPWEMKLENNLKDPWHGLVQCEDFSESTCLCGF
jgi:hypothetical protein